MAVRNLEMKIKSVFDNSGFNNADKAVIKLTAETKKLEQETSGAINFKTDTDLNSIENKIKSVVSETKQLKQETSEPLKISGNTDFNNVETDIKRVVSETKQLEQEMNKAFKIKGDAGLRSVESEVKELTAETKKLEQETSKVAKNSKKISKESDFSGVASKVKGIAAAYFAISGAVSVWNKSIEANNYQLEQETKLATTMKGQGFTDSQIQNVKDYASELQNVGIVGDEVTLAGAQQLATYNLTEKQLKDLMPAMQDVAVQMKGYNVEGGDMVGVANMLAKGIMGQTGMLQKAGITLTEYEQKMIKTGTQSEKVAAIIAAVKENVGEQNKAFLNTPEGKVVSTQNTIGDAYEMMGANFQKLRLEWYNFVGENMEPLVNFMRGVSEVVLAVGNDVMYITGLIKDYWGEASDSVKFSVIAIGIALAVVFAPVEIAIAAIILVVDDFVAFMQGRSSIIGDVWDYMKEKTGEFVDFTKQEINSFKDWIFELGSSIEGFFVGVWDKAMGIVSKIKEEVKSLVDAFETSAFGKVAKALGFEFEGATPESRVDTSGDKVSMGTSINNTNSNATNTTSNVINITTTATDPKQIQEHVENGINRAMQRSAMVGGVVGV